MPYHERHGWERLWELAQDEHGGRAVATIRVTGGGGGRRALDPHVHEAMGWSATRIKITVEFSSKTKKALDKDIISTKTFPQQQVCFCLLLVFAPLNAPIQQQHKVGSVLKLQMVYICVCPTTHLTDSE